jgi:hypothetical protein
LTATRINKYENRTKQNFSILNEIAIKNEGVCLECNIINGISKYKFQCKKAHVWWAESHNIKNGTWCRICRSTNLAIKQRIPIEFYKELAISKGGECLSETWEKKLKFKCKNGHIWSTTGQAVKNGSWCKLCRHIENGIKRRIPIEFYKELAISKGGECLSETWEKKLKFKCKNGHIWSTIGQVVKSGAWCKICSSVTGQAYKKHNIDLFKSLIESKGGKLLTSEYKNSAETRLLVDCGKGHQWLAFPGHIKKGLWCRKCNGSFRHELSDIIKLAESRGGKCLSTVYKNDMTKITWQCSEKHVWDATPNNIKRGKWCPICVSGIGERVCRLTLEKIFGVHFNKTRPMWLKNKLGYQLELDGYNEDLKLAFEHQGMQHYGIETNSKFYTSDLIENDKEKKEVCKANGVTVIYIPELFKYTKLNNLVSFVLSELDKNNFPYPITAHQTTLDSNEVYTYTKTKDVGIRENRALNIIKKNNATLVDIRRLNSGVYLKVKCSNGHELTTNFSSILSGKICKKCILKN